MPSTPDIHQKGYKRIYALVWLPIHFYCRVKIANAQNVPDGPAVICANHSSWIDPLLLSFGVGRDRVVHYMCKKELFDNPILAKALASAGSFPVDRGSADITAIRTAAGFLKEGKMIGIFPEGTRTTGDDGVAAKTGAVRLAEMTGAPILPVYITRKKTFWGRADVVFGELYHLPQGRLSREQREAAATELMDKISTLAPDGEQAV